MKRFLPVSVFLILAFSGCFTEYVYITTCAYKKIYQFYVALT